MRSNHWRLGAGLLCCMLVIAAVPFGAFGQTPQYCVQVGGFAAQSEAQALVEKLATQGFPGAVVRFVESEKTAAKYKVTLGEFPTRDDATEMKTRLSAVGQGGFVRSVGELNPAAIAAALENFSPKAGFFQPVQPAAKAAALPSRIAEKVAAADSGMTTTPEKVKQLRDAIREMPDTNAAKATNVLKLSKRAFVGCSSTSGKKPETYDDIKTELKRVANGQTAATKDDLLTARAQYAKLLHYYDRDKVSALQAYRHVLAEAERDKDDWIASQTRMELAAVLFELSKENNLELRNLEPKLATLWEQSRAVERTYETTTSAVARRSRWTTARIGLMLSEVKLATEQWQSAADLIESMIEVYTPYPECQDELAEAYCHKATAMMKLSRKEECYAAADKSIEIARSRQKPIWGDPHRDVIWKAYNWKTAAASMRFKESRAYVDKLKAQVAAEFPDHPALGDYLARY